MGLGFVLVIWALLGTIAAVFSGVFLAAICAVVQKKYGHIQRRWVIAFAFFPFVCGLYAFFGFIGYGVVCETMRGVDFGTGDGFRAPIVNGYEFQAIDTPSQCYLVAPNGIDSHQGLQEIGESQALIFGRVKAEYFLLDSKTGTELNFPDEEKLRTTLKQRGIAKPELLSPERFYFHHRFGIFDWVAFGFGVGVPILAFFALVIAFVRAIKRRAILTAHLR